jgi:nuclear pore complex protein Nup54
MSLFGSSTATQAAKPFSFNNPTASQPAVSTGSLFGASTSTQPQQQQTSLPSFSFSAPKSQPAQSGGIFGTSTTQTGSGGIFGQSQQNSQPAQQTGGLFGASITQQPSGGLFGTTQNQQNNPSSIFPGGPGAGGASFQPTQPQQPTQRPLSETLRFGQSQSQNQPPNANAQSLWEENRGQPSYRSIPAQMTIVRNKWDPSSLSSPLRTYLYQHVGSDTEALKYRPGPGEDEDKWEQAVTSRPGSEWVPLLVAGFAQLGRKAMIQMEAIQRCNMMLREINTSLDVQMDKHRQDVATRLDECKRRQASTAQRTLSLAVKVQILRNRGYVMDNAEEELKAKLEALQREVFDPGFGAREQEIWARMLGIRERAKRLKQEMEKLAPSASGDKDEPVLDEATQAVAKKVRLPKAVPASISLPVELNTG